MSHELNEELQEMGEAIGLNLGNAIASTAFMFDLTMREPDSAQGRPARDMAFLALHGVVHMFCPPACDDPKRLAVAEIIGEKAREIINGMVPDKVHGEGY